MNNVKKMLLLGMLGGGVKQLIILDEFTDVDTTALASHVISPINTPGKAWVVGAGAWTIVNNKLKPNTFTAGNYSIDTGYPNVDISVVVTLGSTMTGTTEDEGIVFRWIGGNGGVNSDYYWAGINAYDDLIRLGYRYKDVFTTLATVAFPCGVGEIHTLRVIANNEAITVMVDGITKISYTTAYKNRLINKHGLLATRTATLFDDFTIYNLPNPPTPLKIAAVGDSITQQSGNWCYQLANHYNKGNNNFTNSALAGASVYHLAEEIATFASNNEDKVFIMMGQNDNVTTFIESTYLSALNSLKTSHTNATIYALGVLNALSAGGAEPTRTTINGRIASAVTSAGARVVYVDTTGWIDPSDAADTADGIHPTYAGHTKIRDAMIAVLEA